MPLASTPLDFYDDLDHELMSKLACPSSVSRSPMTVLTPEQREALPETDFGLVVITKQAHVLHRFPINDPGNAWVSAQYFQANHEKLAWPARFIAATFIKRACDAYEVPSSSTVEAYAARVEPGEVESNLFTEGSEAAWTMRKIAQRELMTKEASAVEMNALVEMPAEHFALVIQTGDGTTIRKYAMPDAAHVKKAAEYFDKYAMDLAPEHRHRFAASVKNRAEELGIELPRSPAIEKWGSLDWNRHLDAYLEQRKSLLPRNAQAQEVLTKLAA